MLLFGKVGRCAGFAPAAVFGQKTEQLVHGPEVGRINDVTAFLPGGNETGMGEFLHVEGQRRGRNAQRFADFSGGQAFRPGLCQQAEDGQAGFLSKRCEGGDD